MKRGKQNKPDIFAIVLLRLINKIEPKLELNFISFLDSFRQFVAHAMIESIGEPVSRLGMP